MTDLPELEPTRHQPSRRRPTVIAACVAAVIALAAGSIIVLAARDDGTSSIEAGSAADGSPIGADDADIDVYIDDDTLDADFVEVRSFLESNADVTAYTYVTTDQSLSEREVLERCAPGAVGSFGGPVFRLRLDDAAAREPLAEHLASMRAVTRVLINPASAPRSATTAAPASTTLPVSTTSVTSIPTATEPPSSTAPPSSTTSLASLASKEIPFALPAPSECPPPLSTSTPTSTSAVVGRPPATADATLPPAGAQPPDPASAEQAIREMWLYTHDGSVPLEDRFRDHLEDAEVLLPLMKSIGRDDAVQTTQILGVQFVNPTRAAVLSRNVFQGGSLDVAQVQYVVLTDGQWKWTRESECKAIARAGVHCPEGP